MTEFIVVPVKVTALTVEPSIAPPVILVPLIVPETVALVCTINPLKVDKLLTVRPEEVVAPDTVKSFSITVLPLIVPPVRGK